MSPHRTPGDVIPDGEPLPQGPAAQCKACGSPREVASAYVSDVPFFPNTIGGSYRSTSALSQPRACTAVARVQISWFEKCSMPGSHLHEHCRVCGLDWLTAFANPGSTAR